MAGLCGCYQPCTCELNVEPNDLISISGSGDPLAGGWIVTVFETVLGIINTDGAVDIVAGGAYGHEPTINLVIDPASTATVTTSGAGLRVDQLVDAVADTDSIDLTVTGGTLEADLILDPASTATVSVTASGLRVDVPPAPAPVGTVPTGAFFPYMGAAAPVDFLLCDGSLVMQATYPALFAVIGHAGSAGVDPGGGQFQLPDLRGRVPVGVDNMGGVDAGILSVPNTLGHSAGFEAITLTTAQIPAHAHTGGTTNAVGDHTHGTGTAGRSFVTAATATITNVGLNTTTPEGVTRWVAGSSGGPTVQSLALGDEHSIVVGGAGVNKAQLNNQLTDLNGGHSHTVTIPAGGGTGGSHGNMQPYVITNYIIKT